MADMASTSTPNNPTTPKERQLVMANSYNDHSALQRLALLKGINECFQPFLRKFAQTEFGDKVVVADYGCAGGKNSFLMIQAIDDFINEECKESVPLHAFLTDLPRNDFNFVFSAYQESLLAQKNHSNVYLSCTAGSFYDQILRSDSVHIAASFSSVHWLSKTTDLGGFHDPHSIFITDADPVKDKDKIHFLTDLAKSDFQRFLLARKKELVSGGLLLIGCVGCESLIPSQAERAKKDAIAQQQFQKRDINAHPWNDGVGPGVALNYANELGTVLQEAKEHFGIQVSLDSSQTRILPVVPKTVENIYEALQSLPELENGFEILFCEVVNCPEPYWSRYVSGEFDLEAFVAAIGGFNRAWSQSMVRLQLQQNDEAVEWFYQKMSSVIRANPQRFYMENNFLFVCLRKL